MPSLKRWAGQGNDKAAETGGELCGCCYWTATEAKTEPDVLSNLDRCECLPSGGKWTFMGDGSDFCLIARLARDVRSPIANGLTIRYD